MRSTPTTGGPPPLALVAGRARRAAGAAVRPLRIYNYRLYFIGQLVSLSGTWMQTAGLAWLVLHLTGSGTDLGLVTAAQFVPTLLGGAWGGLIADRFDKRRTLLATQTGLGICAAALAAVTLSGGAKLWMLLLLALISGVFTTVDNPTRQAFVTEVVGREYLANAVGLNSVMFNSARIVGPAIAASVIALFGDRVEAGTGLCFGVNAASYLAVLICLAAMRRSQLATLPTIARAKGQIRAGLRYALGEPSLRIVLAMMTLVGLLAFNYQVLLPLLAKTVFAGDAGTYGALSVSLGVGSLLGSLAAASRGRASLRLIVGACAAMGVALALAAVAPTLVLELVAWVAVGASTMTLMAAANTTIQLTARPEMRGRVISFYMLLLIGSTPIGGPLVGWLAEHVGVRWGVGAGAAACLASSLIGLRGWRIHQGREVAAAADLRAASRPSGAGR